MNSISNEIKIIFVDIDNTLFDHLKKHKYDKKSLRSLTRLQKLGYIVIICTARPMYSIREFGLFKHINPDGIIASNGAIRIYKDHWFSQYHYPKKELRKISNLCKKHGLCVEFVTFDDRFYATPKTKLVDFHHECFYENDAEYEPYVDQDVISVLLFAEKKDDQMLKDKMPKTTHLFRFSDYGVDVVTHSHSKGEAVSDMLNHLGIPKDQSLAIGDDLQDIAMFEAVKYGIAMGNAKKELKDISYFVTKEVYHHGVFYFFKSFGFLNKK